jgi:hypothetical protein
MGDNERGTKSKRGHIALLVLCFLFLAYGILVKANLNP